MERFSSFILKTLITTFFVSFVVAYFTSYIAVKKLFENNAFKQTKVLAVGIYDSLYSLLQKGVNKKELLEFLKKTESVDEDKNIRISLIINENSAFKEPKHSKFPYIAKNKVVYYQPLIVKESCLNCHKDFTKGKVIGILKVENDISSMLSNLKWFFLLSIIIAFPTMFLGILRIFDKIDTRVEAFIKEIARAVRDLRRVSDISCIKLQDYDFEFRELEKIRKGLASLLKKIQKTAVDKDILEFEVKLLEKFVITNDAITNWVDFLKAILSEIASVLNFFCFYVIFREKNYFNIYIFWKNGQFKNIKFCRKKLEEEILKELKKSKLWEEGSKAHFEHISLFKELQNKEKKNCPIENITLFSKTLILDKPIIGGAVGIGITSEDLIDQTKKLAIEGFLATVLNIVSSLRAIYKYTEQLEYYATRDSLTGLYNKRVFWELLKYEVERAKRHNYKFALLIIDLDNFKVINDTYGHEFGDEVLKDIAQILKRVFRKEDIVARYGGDEFVAVLPYTDSEKAKKVVQRLISELNKYTKISPTGELVKVHASIGVAIYPDSAQDAKSLFVIADDMLYKAKENGKNRFVIATDSLLKRGEQEKKNIKLLLINAVEKKKVIPYFQPILNLKTGNIEAYEVLMRIKNGDEVLNASKFIDIAEEMGIVYELDSILFENAINKVKGKNCTPKLFFNLSPKEIIIPDFASQIESFIDAIDYPKENIVFEITERETVKSIEELKIFVKKLKDKGLKFAIDDFGSGFASFAYLKHFPVDFVKIEGDFVVSMLRSKFDRVFVENTVALAKMFNIKTVAEFVENEEILKNLKKIDVNYAQGYFIGKPSEKVCN